LRLNSRPTKGARTRAYRRWLLAGCLVAAATPVAALADPVPYLALAQEPTGAPPSNAAASADALRRLNPTGRDVNLTVPLKDGDFYLGDMPLTAAAGGSLEAQFSSDEGR
jgi:outer membrane usher protein